MLAFRMKRALEQVPIDRQLGQKIDQERWGPEGREAVQQVDGMRERMRDACVSYSEKGAAECRDILARYYGMLHKAEIITRGLPLKESGLSFKWQDAFDMSNGAVEPEWGFEKAAVLFNLAASISFLATHEDRGTDDGVKKACALFQEAAGVLVTAQTICSSAPWRGSPDLARDTLSTLETLMLAQAQKCFYEKAEREGKSVGVVAKLAAEAAGLYEEVHAKIGEAKGRARPIAAMTNDWLEVVNWNRLLFDGLQHYHLSFVHLAAFDYGKQLSRLTYATNRCAEAVNACAHAPAALREQFIVAHKKASEEQAKAKRDNDLIYNEKVPDIRTLPKPERAKMVKPIQPSELKEYVSDPVPRPPKL